MGPCVAGGAYLPVMCDKYIIIEGSSMFLAGPALVKAAIGQKIDQDTLGGATTHSAKSANLPALKASSLERVIDNKYRPKPVIARAFIERNLSPIQGTTPEHMFNRVVQGDTIRGWDTDQVTANQKIVNAIPKSFLYDTWKRQKGEVRSFHFYQNLLYIKLIPSASSN